MRGAHTHSSDMFKHSWDILSNELPDERHTKAEYNVLSTHVNLIHYKWTVVKKTVLVGSSHGMFFSWVYIYNNSPACCVTILCSISGFLFIISFQFHMPHTWWQQFSACKAVLFSAFLWLKMPKAQSAKAEHLARVNLNLFYNIAKFLNKSRCAQPHKPQSAHPLRGSRQVSRYSTEVLQYIYIERSEFFLYVSTARQHDHQINHSDGRETTDRKSVV